MGLKKVIFIAAIAIVVGLTVVNMRQAGKDSKVLHVMTWSNYFSDDVIAQFTKRTGIKVELTYMSSNEELLAKLKAGATGFDVIQPSDYMVRQMVKLGMLMPIDTAKIPNLANLDESFRNLPYDPGGKYSVPFTWGTTGIAVNTAKVTVPDGPISWSFLMDSPDPKHTSLLDDMREVFAGVLKWRGHSINTSVESELENAKNDINQVKGRILVFTSEPKALLEKEELTVAHIYSCDAAQAHKTNPKIRYYIPKEGGTLWADNFAVPTTSQNAEAAHAFINFVLDPDVTLSIVREKALATPNRVAKAKLSPEEQNDPMIYPPKEILTKMQWLEDLGPTMQTVSRMWTELKS